MVKVKHLRYVFVIFQVTTSDGRKYLINICGPADPTSGNACNKAMVCLNGVSYGEPNDYQVIKETGELKLTYALGGTCATGHTAQSHILFKCNRNAGIGSPKLLLVKLIVLRDVVMKGLYLLYI